MKKVCENDGVEFESKRATARFCSDKCRKAAARTAGVDADTGEVLDSKPAPRKFPIIKAPKEVVVHDVTPGARIPYDEPQEVTVVEQTLTLNQPSTTKNPDPSSLVRDPLGRTTEWVHWERFEDATDALYIENPFDRPGDPTYDVEKQLAAFKKMGLDEVEWLTTGITGFDALTKIPKGRLTQIEGRFSVGKTTLCLNMARGLKKHKVLYIDTESSLNPALLVQMGLDHGNFDLYNKSAYLEDIAELLKTSVRSGAYELIILDSLAMTTTKTIEEGDIVASNIGQKAKIFNKVLELIMGDLRKTKTALVIINQTRDVIGSYTPQTYTPGGSGKDYNASLKISLKTIPSWRFGRTATDTKKKLFIGQKVEATITKSKVNTPHRTAEFKLFYSKPRQVAEPA